MKKFSLIIVLLFCLGTVTKAQYRALLNFNYADGAVPWGSLTLSGGVLYGMTNIGGADTGGVIFSIDTNGSGYNDLHDFKNPKGLYPEGNVTRSGGKLYGMTTMGGPMGVGNIFCIDTNGNNYKDLLDFNHNTGGFPEGSLIASGGKLYGMTIAGTSSSDGGIFSIDTNGTNFKNLYDLQSRGAFGSLTLSGGVLYGMSPQGGMWGSGYIFAIDTNGSNFRDLFDFHLTNGAGPEGSLTLSGGKMYGMTAWGGALSKGNIFSIDTNGGNFKDLFDFDGTNGWDPLADLTLNNGVLYGTTFHGGVANDSGVIFSIDTNGSGFKDLYYFTWGSGFWPSSTLNFAGGLLYGTARLGGANGNNGVVFSFNPVSLNLVISSTLYYCPTYASTATAYASGGTPPYSYLWSPGGQTTTSLTGLSAGMYSLTVTDSMGKTKTDSVLVSTGSISLYVTGFPSSITMGDSAYLYSSCNLPATFSWAPSISVTNPNSQQSYAKPTVTTTYTCTATTACGAYTDTVTIFINCANNFDESICIVTVDTAANRDEIIWGRLNSPPTGSYNVYKENSSFTFSLLVNQPLTNLSDYIDTSSRPWLAPCTYELSTTDSCGLSLLSSAHTTIYLTDTAETNVNVLNWTAYVGFTPSEYRIFRGASLSTLVQIDSVNSSTLTYHDTLPPASCVYMIEAINPSGPCTPTTRIKPHSPEGTVVSMSNRRKIITTGIPVINRSITNLNIYPNPSNGQVTIEWAGMNSLSPLRISIMDELGQIVYDNTETQTVGKNKKQINLENLASGIYMLRMQSDVGSTVRKVMIMHSK